MSIIVALLIASAGFAVVAGKSPGTEAGKTFFWYMIGWSIGHIVGTSMVILMAYLAWRAVASVFAP